jgi:hypothetical protein
MHDGGDDLMVGGDDFLVGGDGEDAAVRAAASCCW